MHNTRTVFRNTTRVLCEGKIPRRRSRDSTSFQFFLHQEVLFTGGAGGSGRAQRDSAAGRPPFRCQVDVGCTRACDAARIGAFQRHEQPELVLSPSLDVHAPKRNSRCVRRRQAPTTRVGLPRCTFHRSPSRSMGLRRLLASWQAAAQWRRITTSRRGGSREESFGRPRPRGSKPGRVS